MEQTPLELYETAYKYHYIERKIPEAVACYEQLISEFPESNECGYATIQLQKIKTQKVSDDLRYNDNKTEGILFPLTVITFIIGCISVIACGGSIYYFKKHFEIEKYQTSLSISALAKISRGEDEEALKMLTEVKSINKKDITPFELSADIYKRAHQFKKAKEEYELFYRLNPDRQASPAEIAAIESYTKLIDQEKSKRNINKTELSGKSNVVSSQSSGNELQNDSLRKMEDGKIIAKEKVNSREGEQKAVDNRDSIKQQGKTATVPTKGPFVVDPDSLSYF